MLDLRYNYLYKHYLLVIGIIESVYAFETVVAERIYELLGELQYVKKDSPPLVEEPIGAICDDIQARLAWATDQSYPLTETDRTVILRACDELRLHLMTGAIALAPTADKAPRFGKDSALSSRDRRPCAAPIIHGGGQLVHASVADFRLIAFPRPRSEEQWSEIFDELIDIYEHKTVGESWVIDLSLLDELPSLFLANITAYAGRLRADDDELYLAWLRAGLLNDEQFARAQRTFRLEQLGSYYFSDSPALKPSGRPESTAVVTHSSSR